MGQAIRKQNIYNKVQISECKEILNYIYVNEDECFIRVLSKGKGKNKSYPIESVKEPIKLNAILNSFGNEDIFISLNPFRSMSSSTRKNLFCINAIAVDVDYKKIKYLKDLEPVQIINLLELDFFDMKIPAPNLIEYGNQIRLIYGIETCYIPKNKDNVVVLAQRISQVFANELKEYGAERQDLESYFRVPGSINTKNSSEVKMYSYEDSIRYTLRELQELWLDELPKWYKKRNGRTKTNKKVVKLHNVYALNSNRLLDFEKIQEFLNSCGDTDLRARLCFLYRNYFLIKIKYQNGELKNKDYEDAKSAMLRFNSNFNEPLRDRVIESATRVVNHRQYLYKNDTLVNFLELDYRLCEDLGLQSIYKVKTKEKRNEDYYKRHKESRLKAQGKISEKEKISQRRAKIKDLLVEGLKQKDICLKLNISKPTYIRDRNYLKEQGLI